MRTTSDQTLQCLAGTRRGAAANGSLALGRHGQRVAWRSELTRPPSCCGRASSGPVRRREAVEDSPYGPLHVAAVHAQPAARMIDEQRALSDRSANLCRNNPVLWSAMVRYEDGMVRAGAPADEARKQALELCASIRQC